MGPPFSRPTAEGRPLFHRHFRPKVPKFKVGGENVNKVRAALSARFGRGRLRRLRSDRGDWMTYINWAIGIGAGILVGYGVLNYLVPAVNGGMQGQTTCFFGSNSGSVNTSCQQAPTS